MRAISVASGNQPGQQEIEGDGKHGKRQKGRLPPGVEKQRRKRRHRRGCSNAVTGCQEVDGQRDWKKNEDEFERVEEHRDTFFEVLQ